MAELVESPDTSVQQLEIGNRDVPQEANAEKETRKPVACIINERCRNVLLLCIFLACFSLAIWATFTGRMEDGVKVIADLHFAIICLLIVVLMLFVNLPCGWGYSIVVTSAGFGVGWKGLPPVWIGGVLLGPWLAWFVSRQILLRDKTPESLISKVPHKRSRRVIQAIVTGVHEDKYSVLIVAATRPSPLVSGWQNLVLSIAAPPFWSCYVVGTIIGGTPDSILYTYIGILLREATDEASSTSDTLKLVVYILQVVACLCFLVLISCAARRVLAKYQRDEEAAVEAAVQPAETPA